MKIEEIKTIVKLMSVHGGNGKIGFGLGKLPLGFLVWKFGKMLQGLPEETAGTRQILLKGAQLPKAA